MECMKETLLIKQWRSKYGHHLQMIKNFHSNEEKKMSRDQPGKVSYYIGVVSDTAYFLSDSKYDIRVPNGLNWLNLSYDQLLEECKEEERGRIASRLQQPRR